MSVTAARSLSLCESSPLCQGSGLAARLLREAFMSTVPATPTSLKLSEMLDEPAALIPFTYIGGETDVKLQPAQCGSLSACF